MSGQISGLGQIDIFSYFGIFGGVNFISPSILKILVPSPWQIWTDKSEEGLCVGGVVGLRLDHGNVDVDDPIWDLMRRRGCHGPLPGCSYCLVCWAQSTGRVNSCLVVVIVVQT